MNNLIKSGFITLTFERKYLVENACATGHQSMGVHLGGWVRGIFALM
jgi:hypothetical protein